MKIKNKMTYGLATTIAAVGVLTVGAFVVAGPSDTVLKYSTCATEISGNPCVSRAATYDPVGELDKCRYEVVWEKGGSSFLTDYLCDGTIEEIVHEENGLKSNYLRWDKIIGETVCQEADGLAKQIDTSLLEQSRAATQK